MKSYSFAVLLAVCILCCFSAFSQNIGGIGAQLKLDSSGGHTMPVIQKLVPGSPAAAALKENQFIIRVDDSDCKDRNLEQIVTWIRGVVGSPVKMTVADNKAGKHAQEFTLTRAAIAAPPDNPAADPATAFYTTCEAEVKQMKRKGITIIKTFNSECGNFFFNFDAEPLSYTVQAWILSSAIPANNNVTINVFDNDDEKNPTRLGNAHPKAGATNISELSGSITFRKETVGTISVQLNDAAAKCQAMYIVVYRQ